MRKIILALGLLIYLGLMAIVIMQAEHRAAEAIKGISCTPTQEDEDDSSRYRASP